MVERRGDTDCREPCKWASGTCQATFYGGPEGDVPGNVPGDVIGILAGCGSTLFGVELDGGKAWRHRLPGALQVSLWHVPGNCFMGF